MHNYNLCVVFTVYNPTEDKHITKTFIRTNFEG